MLALRDRTKISVLLAGLLLGACTAQVADAPLAVDGELGDTPGATGPLECQLDQFLHPVEPLRVGSELVLPTGIDAVSYFHGEPVSTCKVGAGDRIRVEVLRRDTASVVVQSTTDRAADALPDEPLHCSVNARFALPLDILTRLWSLRALQKEIDEPSLTSSGAYSRGQIFQVTKQVKVNPIWLGDSVVENPCATQCFLPTEGYSRVLVLGLSEDREQVALWFTGGGLDAEEASFESKSKMPFSMDDSATVGNEQCPDGVKFSLKTSALGDRLSFERVRCPTYGPCG